MPRYGKPALHGLQGEWPGSRAGGYGGLIAAALTVTVLLAAILGRILSHGLRRDEMLYVPPAALLPDLALYRDVFYNHVPNSAWLF